MLIDEQYGNVFSLLRKIVESLFYGRVLCLGIDD